MPERTHDARHRSRWSARTPLDAAVRAVAAGARSPHGTSGTPRRTLGALLAVAAISVLTGCSSTATPEFMVDQGLDGLTGREIVEHLDSSADARPLPIAASVREDEVVLGDGTTEIAVPLPDDLDYVAIAPYVTTTHECYYHSLGTCQGELVGQEIQVRVLDDQGAEILEERVATHSNGFVGFWLPQDITGTIEVSSDGLTGRVPFSTADGEPTCITTLQLT